MKFRLAAALIALTVSAVPAQAVITSITLSGGSAFTAGGTASIVAQPLTFAPTGNNVRGFNELRNVTLGLGGQSPRGSVFDSTGLNLTAVQNIVSALPVSSHFIYMTRAAGGRTYEGTISFNQNVIAIQRGSNLFSAPRSAQLHNGLTDFTTLGGSPGTEIDDVIRLINPKTISFSMNVGATNSDAFRVLTAVPEPKSWAMMMVGFGLVGFGLRRRAAAVAA